MKKLNDKFLLLIYVVGIGMLLILRDLSGVAFSKFIFLAFALAMMAMACYETLVQMLCFTFPLICGLPDTYLMLGALLLLIAKRKAVNYWQLGMLFFLVVAEIVASFWYPKMDLVAIVNYVSFAGTMFFLIQDKLEMDYEECVQQYLYGTVLLFAVIIISTLRTAPRNWIDAFARGAFRFGQEHMEELGGMALTLNANSLAYYSVMGIFCGIFLAEKKRGIRRTLNVAIAVFAAIAGFLSLSRSWLVVSFVCLLLYVFSKLRSPKQFLAMALVLLVVFTAGSIYLQQHPELTDGFIARMTDDTMGSANGRTDIFRDYMNAFFADVRILLFGAGAVQYKAVLNQSFAMHNGTQQILVCYGVFGFVVFVWGLARAVLLAKGPRKRKNATDWLPLISVALFVQTIQFIQPPMIMLPFVIGIYALKAVPAAVAGGNPLSRNDSQMATEIGL